MPHIHTLSIERTGFPKMVCDGCDIDLRCATSDEAVFVKATDTFAPDGPMVWNNGVIVVPANFSIFQEA